MHAPINHKHVVNQLLISMQQKGMNFGQSIFHDRKASSIQNFISLSTKFNIHVSENIENTLHPHIYINNSITIVIATDEFSQPMQLLIWVFLFISLIKKEKTLGMLIKIHVDSLLLIVWMLFATGIKHDWQSQQHPSNNS